MLRLALTPRWIAGLVVLLVLVSTAVMLGRWQWERTQVILELERAAAAEPTPVEGLFPVGDAPFTEIPTEGIGRPVTVTGSYDPALQVAVVNRSLQDMAGVWIVTGLRIADDRVVPVLRGWLPSADDALAAPPTGPVTVTGVLHPDESFYSNVESPPGTVATITQPRLEQTWGTDVLPGYVVLKSQDPPLSAAPSPVPSTVQSGDVPFPLQNFFYAFQWWIFGGFAIAVYLRWLWIETDREPQDA